MTTATTSLSAAGHLSNNFQNARRKTTASNRVPPHCWRRIPHSSRPRTPYGTFTPKPAHNVSSWLRIGATARALAIRTTKPGRMSGGLLDRDGFTRRRHISVDRCTGGKETPGWTNKEMILPYLVQAPAENSLCAAPPPPGDGCLTTARSPRSLSGPRDAKRKNNPQTKSGMRVFCTGLTSIRIVQRCFHRHANRRSGNVLAQPRAMTDSAARVVNDGLL